MTESTAHRAAEMFNAGASTKDVTARFGGHCTYDSPVRQQYVYDDGKSVRFDLVEHYAEVVE